MDDPIENIEESDLPDVEFAEGDQVSIEGIEQDDMRIENLPNLEQVDDVLTNFQPGNWDSGSMETKENNVEDLTSVLSEGMQLENHPNVVFYEELSSTMGYSNENEIGFNRLHMDDPIEAADTVAHELRHHWQTELAADPDNELGQAFQHNFDNYIRPEDDYYGYENQLVEVDARSFASGVKDRIQG